MVPPSNAIRTADEFANGGHIARLVRLADVCGALELATYELTRGRCKRFGEG